MPFACANSHLPTAIKGLLRNKLRDDHSRLETVNFPIGLTVRPLALGPPFPFGGSLLGRAIGTFPDFSVFPPRPSVVVYLRPPNAPTTRPCPILIASCSRWCGL